VHLDKLNPAILIVMVVDQKSLVAAVILVASNPILLVPGQNRLLSTQCFATADLGDLNPLFHNIIFNANCQGHPCPICYLDNNCIFSGCYEILLKCWLH
jgi:hypothetical protein